MSLLEYVERGEADNVCKLLESRAYANVDQTNADGETVLMIAAQKGFIDIVKLLLSHGANPTLTTPVRKIEDVFFFLAFLFVFLLIGIIKLSSIVLSIFTRINLIVS